MNPTDAKLPRQATLNKSASVDSDEDAFPHVPYDHPSWFRSPVLHNGHLGDADFWELGPAIPPGSRFVVPTRRRARR